MHGRINLILDLVFWFGTEWEDQVHKNVWKLTILKLLFWELHGRIKLTLDWVFWFGFPFGNPNPSPSFVSDGIILKFVAIVLMLKCAIILWMCCNDAVHVFRNYTAFTLQFCNQCSIIIQHMCCKWDAIPMYCLCLKNLSILFFFIYLLSIILVPSEIQTLMSLTLLVWLWQNTKSPL